MMSVAVILILLVNLSERFCFYTINGTQVNYMKSNLGIASQNANAIILVLQTACYVSCIPGGIIGEKIGRFPTIVLFALVYLCGAAAITISTVPEITSYGLFMLGSFGGLALGSGGIKPNVPNFGADQVVDKEQREAFFAYFYWMINLGSAVALGLMSTVTSSPASFGIGTEYGYVVAYGIAACSMLLAFVLFVSGKPKYLGVGAMESRSLMRPIMKSVIYSAKSSGKAKVALSGWILLVPFLALSFVQAFLHGPTGLNVAIITACIGLVSIVCLGVGHLNNDWLVLAPDCLNGALSEEESRQTFQSVPMLLIANMVFNLSYAMMLAPFIQQSCQMNLAIGGTTLSGTVFNLGDCFAVILFIPIFDIIIFPALKWCTGRPMSNEGKLVGGFAFAALSMITAVIIEIVRRNSSIITPVGDVTPHDFYHNDTYAWLCTPSEQCYDVAGGPLMGQCLINGVQYCSSCSPQSTFDDVSYGIYASTMSGMIMFLPFALIGVGEILVNPTTMYYSYNLTPPRTRSVMQAMNMLFQGGIPPAFVSVVTTLLGSTSSPNDLNRGNCEYLYYAALVVIFVGTILFFLAKSRAKITLPVDSSDPIPRQSSSIVETAAALLMEREGVIGDLIEEPRAVETSLVNRNEEALA